MSNIAIKVENLSKRYRIGLKDEMPNTFVGEMISWLKAPFTSFKRLQKLTKFDEHEAGGKEQGGLTNNRELITDNSTPNDDIIWALKDVSLEVKHGEVLGIIGRNGAGKTTLLKILSRITEPTFGHAIINGRVSSLLEVGTGFHPELTGRENIYLNGTILGMSKKEIDSKFDEIVAFSEIVKFLDTPVKRYSSGTHVRLAFAVAAHLEPEILLVDEVLAVGDLAFQKKCLGKMGDVAKEGRTVLFVSHNMGAINSLTKKSVLLHNGELLNCDKTPLIVNQYLSESMQHRDMLKRNFDFYRRDPFSEGKIVRFKQLWVNEPDEEFPTIEMGSSFSVFVEIEAFRTIHGANLDMQLKDINGNIAVCFFSWDQNFRLFFKPGKHIIELHISDLPLVPGKYFAGVGVNQSISGTAAFDVVLDYPIFEVVNSGKITYWLDRPWGSVHWENLTWRILK